VVKKIADEHGARIDLSNRYQSASGKVNAPGQDAGDNDMKMLVGAQVILSFAVV
jgi:hypothetical protein